MNIPAGFVVPPFILDHVFAAPEELSYPTDAAAATERLKNLKTALQCPEILNALAVMVRDMARIDAQIDQQVFQGQHDVFTQQQVIGEKRGLRRFFVEIQEAHDTLEAAINNK